MAAKERKISPLHGPVTQKFMDEVTHYNFQFLCEQCVFFDEEKDLCAHSYPSAPHRTAYFKDEPIGKVLIFCREFDTM